MINPIHVNISPSINRLGTEVRFKWKDKHMVFFSRDSASKPQVILEIVEAINKLLETR